jgi:hypothetical protein
LTLIFVGTGSTAMGGIQGSIQKGCDEAPLHTESSGWGQIFLETWTEGCCSVNMKTGENHGLVGDLEHFLCSHILGIIIPIAN